MLRALVCLMLALQSMTPCLAAPENRVPLAMKTGVLLRMHVVAQDDTEAMQRLKLVVRDEVRRAYEEGRPSPAPSMLAAAADMLPELTDAAVQAARAQGYQGQVAVAIETADFDERELDGHIIPAGRYPALMIRLGNARGHNWWGLIDPELSLRAASLPGDPQGESIEWDWSLQGLISALLGLPLTAREADHA